MSAKKPGKPRKARSSKLTLKKQTVKDLTPSKGAGRGAKGGAVTTATITCITPYRPQTQACAGITPYKGVQPGP